MTTIATLRERYTEVKEKIGDAERRAGMSPGEVMLVAVTKSAEPDQIRELVQMGQADLAENRVQQLVQRAAIIDEWLSRQRTMPSTGWRQDAASDAGDGRAIDNPDRVRWHMVGHLQRNKVRKVIDVARLIHSVDSLRVAEEAQAIAAKRDISIDVLLQVNASEEAQKYGCAVPAAIHLAEQIDTMIQVRLRGLMTMGTVSEDPDETRRAFARARELFTEIHEKGIAAPDFNILSMGMSNDFEMAIEEGANLVRVGSAIFGEGAGDHEDQDDE